MTRSLIFLFLISGTFSAQAKSEIEQWIANRTFDVHDSTRNIQYRQYFSPLGITYASQPENSSYRQGQWYEESGKLCIKWPNPASVDCYVFRRNIDQIKLLPSTTADNQAPAFALSNPQYGNQFYKLLTSSTTSSNPDQDEYLLAPGINTRAFSITITTPRSDERIGDLTSSPSLIFRSHYNPFTSVARVGWYLEAGMSYYDVEDDCVFCLYADESRAAGVYAYLMPTLYFSITNPARKNRHNGQWLFGISYGLSYVHGDAYLDGLYNNANDGEYVEYSMQGYMYDVFFDYNLKYFKVRIAASGSKYKKGTTSIEIDDIGGHFYLSLYF